MRVRSPSMMTRRREGVILRAVWMLATITLAVRLMCNTEEEGGMVE